MYDYYIEKRARGGSLQRLKEFQVWIFRLPMALPFYFLLSFLFFLPKIYCSCSPKQCGDITIKYPFYVVDTRPTLPDSPPPDNGLSMAPTGHLSECNGIYKISCGGGQAKIRLGSDEFAVMNISYSDHIVLIINDPRRSPPPSHKPCGFFVNFQPPFYNSLELLTSYIVNDLDDSPDCDDNFVIPPILSHELYNLTKCKDYNIHYWNESDHDAVAAQPAFEWILSFNEQNDDLSLMSFGFSQNIQFLEDCFNSQVGGKDCTCNNGGVNSICAGETSCKPKKNKGEIIGIVCGTVGGFVVLSILVIFCYKRKKRYHQSGLSGLLSWSSSSKISSKRDVEVGESSNYHTHIFSYDELEEATGGFNASRELGDGGFGTVYKGKLRDGRTVAVKRLYDHNYRRLEQFMNEVEILSRLRHQNLVTLYGCTSRHSRELLLVYEYIPNGTVGDHLHGALASKASLSWPIRLSIAIETADALAYLHHVEPQIIHRDVKTNNILLDNNHHVKVADFGLSRLFPLDATHVSTAPQGTPGYVDPEYHQCYQLTDKSDVYSFGVVLIELISSKPAVDISRHRHEINLANLAVNKIQNCQLDQLVDPNLGYDVDLEVKRMIDQVAELGFRCLQSDREMRPGIREVLEMLRVIEDGGYKEGEGDGSDVMTKEESRLLKRGVPVSPDTVTGRWPSRTSTPNTST